MKKLIMSALLIVATLSMAETKYISKEKINELSKSKILANMYTRIIEGIDENDTYFLDLQLKSKNANAFVDKKSGVIYIGDRYTKDGRKSIFIKSPERMAKFYTTIKEGISFTYGTGKKELYLFTDPECPYCKRFEKTAKGLLNDYTVHVILYPLKFHKKAPAMTEWIMQGTNDKEKYERMKAVMIENSQTYTAFLPKAGKVFQYSSNIQSILNKGKQAVRLLGVRGTPSIFDVNFTKMNWGKLLQDERKKQQTIKK